MTRQIVTLIISAGNITECSVIPALMEVIVSFSSGLFLAPAPAVLHSPMLLLTYGPEKYEREQVIQILQLRTRTPRPAFGERPS